MRILAICGSLRAASINAALLRAVARLSPADIQIELLAGIGELPLFNPDLESALPAKVAAFQEKIAAADALIIASPEYAHGVSGTIKNALDWLVSFEPFVHKPVAVFNASPRAHHAIDALLETLRTMSAVIVEQASLSVPLLGANLATDDMVARPEIALPICAAIEALRSFVISHESYWVQ